MNVSLPEGVLVGKEGLGDSVLVLDRELLGCVFDVDCALGSDYG